MLSLQPPQLRLHNEWVIRREFGPHPASDLLEVLPRWWTGNFNEHGEPEDAEVFPRRIDAEAAYRTVHGQIDCRARAQLLSDALAEADPLERRRRKVRALYHYAGLAAEAAVGVPARLGRTDETGQREQEAAPAFVSAVGRTSP